MGPRETSYKKVFFKNFYSSQALGNVTAWMWSRVVAHHGLSMATQLKVCLAAEKPKLPAGFFPDVAKPEKLLKLNGAGAC